MAKSAINTGFLIYFLAKDSNFDTMHPLWKLGGAFWVRGYKANVHTKLNVCILLRNYAQSRGTSFEPSHHFSTTES